MAATADRVKQLLWSFLSSNDAENTTKVDLQDTSDKVQEDNSNGFTPRSKQTICPQDQDAYFERVSSYTATTWFAKPAFLSPLVCARYGWVNVEKDMLKCVTCKAHISGHLPSSSKPAVVNACYSRMVDQLNTGHKPICPWSSYPSPEYFAEITLSSSGEAVKLFRERCLQLANVKRNLPVMKKSIIHEMGLNQALSESLVRLCSDWPEDCEEEHKVAAVVLSITGWIFTGKVSAPLVRCVHCNREVGLWNFQCFCHPPQTPDPEDMVPSPVFNGSILEQMSDSASMKSPQGENSSALQSQNGDIHVKDSVQLNLQSAMDSEESLNAGSAANAIASEVQYKSLELNQEQNESPDMFSQLFEPIFALPQSKAQENKVEVALHDVGAMGDGLHADLSGVEEPDESDDGREDEEHEVTNTLESSENSSGSAEMQPEIQPEESSEEEEGDESEEENRETIEDDDSDPEDDSRELGNTNESGSSNLNRSFDSTGQDSHSLEHGSSDGEVPADGVNVSGDDSDIEIVIMDSSDEEKPSDEQQTQVERGDDSDEDEEDEESEDEEEDDDSEEEQVIPDAGQGDDSGSESEREEQRGGGWGVPPGDRAERTEEDNAQNISVEKVPENTGEDQEEEKEETIGEGEKQNEEGENQQEEKEQETDQKENKSLMLDKSNIESQKDGGGSEVSSDHEKPIEVEMESQDTNSDDNIDSQEANGDDNKNIDEKSESLSAQTEATERMSPVTESNKDSSPCQKSRSPSIEKDSDSDPSTRNTGKHSCQSDDDSQPAKKRQKIVTNRRPHFHPLKEHRTWCPWSLSSQPMKTRDTSALSSGSPVSQSMSPYRNGANPDPGWKKVLLMLLPELSPNKSLAEIAKTTPPHQSLRSIRQLFKQWQSPSSSAPIIPPSTNTISTKSHSR